MQTSVATYKHTIPAVFCGGAAVADYYGADNDNYVAGAGFCCEPQAQTKNARSIPTENVDYERLQYYYHSDHLGSASYITNLDGEVVQHIEYVPFGEVFLEERNNTWNTPFLFNGKELDEETGLYYYGARYYDPRISLWYGVDPLAEKTMTPYAYCYNNPILLVDPDGAFPILINGKVEYDSERANSSYWDSGILSTISYQTGYSQNQFVYVDGDKSTYSNKRSRLGKEYAKTHASEIYAKLKASAKGGQITEQLQVITHSRGSAYGEGYMEGLRGEITRLAENDGLGFAYGSENLIEYSVNLAPHQSNSLNYEDSGTKNVNISHIGDLLSGNDARGNVINIHSIPEKDAGPIKQHMNGSHNTELNFILNILEHNTDKSYLLNQVKSTYQQYDRSRTNGDKSKVTQGSN